MSASRCVDRCLSALVLIALVAAPAPDARAQAGRERGGPAFEVTSMPEVSEGPITARVYVMLGPEGAPQEPRFGPNWFDTQPFFAVEAKGWMPGKPLRIGPDAVGFPAPLDELEPGTYAAQAVVRLNPDSHRIGTGPGNAFGPVATVEIVGDEDEDGPIPLVIDRVVPEEPFPETERIKLLDIPSPLLSEFYGRPIRQRAAVILPGEIVDGENEGEGDGDGGKRFPTLYIIPGFGGSHLGAERMARRMGFGEQFVRVVLDPECGTGHHVFADSASNGPRGRALVEELIPHVEGHYPVVPEHDARLLWGHSSGGWSSLWLQVTYPKTFGGVWSTAPDPVDFRDFQRIDLYAPGANMFRDPEGNRRPVARRGTEPFLWYDDFSRMEDVIGDGGQLHSFEAVFSPRGADGKPLPLWDRATGDVDPEVAEAWKAYDIRLVLERNWDRLAPDLAGKLHVYTGGLDTFYLEGAVELLKQSLERLGSDAVVEVIPGKDHGTVLDPEMARRLDREMRAAVARFLAEPVAAGVEEAGR